MKGILLFSDSLLAERQAKGIKVVQARYLNDSYAFVQCLVDLIKKEGEFTPPYSSIPAIYPMH